MFGALREAVERLEIPADGDALAEGFALVDRLVAKLTAAVAAFDAWEADGATSMTAWLRVHAGMTGSTAKSTVCTARRLAALPITAAAWQSGELSGGQVQAVVRNLDDCSVRLFAEHEATVVPRLCELTVAETAVAMQAWKARADALLDEPVEAERGVHLSRTLDGRWELSGSLEPEGGEVVSTALRLASVDDAAVPPSRRRADALVDVCRFFLDHQSGRRGGRHRPHLNVVVDWDDLLAGRAGRFAEGGLLDAVSTQALACDAAVHRVVTDGRSTILDYGTSTRTVPVNLWSALVLRDRHCRFAGCDRPSQWCEAHHVVAWQHGGPTSLDNLVLACSRHHHLCHQPGWSQKLKPDGEFVVTDPCGRTRSSRPPGDRRCAQASSQRAHRELPGNGAIMRT